MFLFAAVKIVILMVHELSQDLIFSVRIWFGAIIGKTSLFGHIRLDVDRCLVISLIGVDGC